MTKVADWSAEALRDAEPKVSVALITYGHEAFIAEAIDGVLMQDVDFPIELVIGEDCSPDGTREIILRYVERYPGLIRLSEYEQNIGPNANFRTNLERCRGTYVALLDGDDYWKTEDKLSRQVALMDAHPDLSLCFHSAMAVYDDGSRPSKVVSPRGRRPVYRLADLCVWMGINNSTMLFRRSALPGFPDWFSTISFGDWSLQVILACRGDIGYIDDVMAVYRLHGGSVWIGSNPKQSEALRLNIEHLRIFQQHIAANQQAPFLRAQYRRYYELVHALLDEGNPEAARQAFDACYGEIGYDPRVEPLEPFLALFHLNHQRLYRWLNFNAPYLNNLWRRAFYRVAALARLGR